MKPKVSIEDYRAQLAKVPKQEFVRLAAFIDGEGCITISGSPARNKKALSRNHCMVITVTNTNPLLFQWLIPIFGGSVTLANSNYKKKHTLPCWRWLLNEHQSEEVLRKCLPYFILKAEQAKLALAFRDIKRWKYQEQRNRRVTPSMLADRDAMQQKMMSLNSIKGWNRKSLNAAIVMKGDKPFPRWIN